MLATNIHTYSDSIHVWSTWPLHLIRILNDPVIKVVGFWPGGSSIATVLLSISASVAKGRHPSYVAGLGDSCLPSAKKKLK